MTTIHDIVSGHVTRRERPRRYTPNWLKALYAFLVTVAVVFTVAILVAPQPVAQQPETGVCQQSEEAPVFPDTFEVRRESK